MIVKYLGCPGLVPSNYVGIQVHSAFKELICLVIEVLTVRRQIRFGCDLVPDVSWQEKILLVWLDVWESLRVSKLEELVQLHELKHFVHAAELQDPFH